MRNGTRGAVRSSLLVVLVAALVVAAAAVSRAGATAEMNDSVVGGFEDRLGEKIGLSAQSGPSGEDPFGHESVTAPQVDGNFKIRSRVTCLAVSGNLAAWGTVATESTSNTLPPGTEFVEVARDGGPAGAADGWDFFDAAAEDCEDFLAAAATAPPIESGNISVHDAQP